MAQTQRHIAILGTVGVPASYGGFETLAEQLARHHAREARGERLSITCAGAAVNSHPRRFAQAELNYLPLHANGAASVPYDIFSLARARRAGVDAALLLGVSGALALPFLAGRRMRVIAHVDGQEWRRAKWSPAARRFLRLSEGLAMRHADAVVADSHAIADDLWDRYGRRAEVITYGGDQATTGQGPLPPNMPQAYALAICRIEPENNVAMVLAACAAANMPLVFVGNWNRSRYGRTLRAQYATHPNLHLLDPIYAPGSLLALRRGATVYLHGHSAGGTNPSLVEMMHVGRPVYAFDCIFNRQTTGGLARYFHDAASLRTHLRNGQGADDGKALQALAKAQYTWARIGAQYFDLFDRVCAVEPWAQKSKMSSRKDPRRFFLPRP